jgi:membrane fusion protein (multidrug efflux system)
VRVVIRGISLPDAIVIPRQAVSQGPEGPYVYVVGANNTAQSRPIRFGREVEAGWVVQEGLQPGDRVVVDGVMRVRPGAPVRLASASANPPPPSAQANGGGPTTGSTAGARP